MRLPTAILLTLFLFSVLLETVSAQAGGISIKKTYTKPGEPLISLELNSLIERLPASGYYPVRVTIVNDGPIDRTWQFFFTSSRSNFDRGNRLKSDFTVTCNATSVAGVDLLVPVMSILNNRNSGWRSSSLMEPLRTQLDVTVRPSPPLETSWADLRTEIARGASSLWPSVIYSEEIQNLNDNALDKATADHLSGSSSRAPRSSVEFGGLFLAKSMPDDWRAYIGYDACILTDKEWNELPAGARNALRKWNRLGGSLIIYTTNPATDLNTLGFGRDTTGPPVTDPGWGTTILRPFPSDGLLEAPEVVQLVVDAVKKTGGPRISDPRDNFRSSWKLQDALGIKTSQLILVIIVLVAFGILVGPINLFVFARAGKRHKLFISTPLISLGASIILLGLILLQDGFGGYGKRLILQEIGPGNTAYISQEQIARTGVLLNTSFTTSEPGYLTPLTIGESRWARITESNDGGNGVFNVELTETGLAATGDWFKSSSEHGHLLETVRPSRERISLVGNSDNPTINSTFGFMLEKVFFRDLTGQLWTTSDIQQGRNTSMTPAEETEFAPWFNGLQQRFGPRNRARLDLARNRRGYFFGFAPETEGISSLTSIDWETTSTFVTGQLFPRNRSNP